MTRSKRKRKQLRKVLDMLEAEESETDPVQENQACNSLSQVSAKDYQSESSQEDAAFSPVREEETSMEEITNAGLKMQDETVQPTDKSDCQVQNNIIMIVSETNKELDEQTLKEIMLNEQGVQALVVENSVKLNSETSVSVKAESIQDNDDNEMIPEINKGKTETIEAQMLSENHSTNTEMQFVFPVQKGEGRESTNMKKGKIVFVCEFCNKEFKRDSKLLYHKMFSKCKFKLVPGELEHIEAAIRDVEKNVKKPVCNNCNKKFLRMEEARLHYIGRVCQKLNSYHNPNNFTRNSFGDFVCPVCNFSHRKASKLTVHMKREHLERNFTCEICQKTFVTELDLKTHVKWAHTAKQVIIPCEICQKEVKLTQLKSHMKYHHDPAWIGKKKYKPLDYDLICEICCYTTRHSSLLHRHKQRYHSDGPGFQCEKCDRKFKIKEDLKKHSIVHSEEERELNTTKCNVCDKSILKRNLGTHMKTVHQKVKNHKCQTCSKAFATKVFKGILTVSFSISFLQCKSIDIPQN